MNYLLRKFHGIIFYSFYEILRIMSKKEQFEKIHFKYFGFNLLDEHIYFLLNVMILF